MLTLGLMMFLMLAVDETTPPVVETITVTAASRRPERIVEAPASVSA